MTGQLLIWTVALCLTALNIHGQISYSYLKTCFSPASTDSFDVEILGIGTVKWTSMTVSNDSKDAGLECFAIPDIKLKDNSDSLVGKVAKHHINLWKNNSRVLKNKSMKFNGCSVIDLRLHMIIENVLFQTIIICDNRHIYQVSCFSESNQKIFDNFLKKTESQDCPW